MYILNFVVITSNSLQLIDNMNARACVCVSACVSVSKAVCVPKLCILFGAHSADAQC